MTQPVTLLVAQQTESRVRLAGQLRERGLQVVEASSDDEACGLAEVGHVDVVVAVHLPGEDGGRHLARRLQSIAGGESLPVIVVGGCDTSDPDGQAMPAALVADSCEVDELVAVLTRAATRVRPERVTG
ncbi:hypothetical protein [Luteitalea sp.]|uniref:hypothetical protein n=1 Tax=Luteitalea sp. TaxID=2004800 RepID=UPI0025B9DE2B|nr:hypothetical protein [Luteitalea sp.]